MSKTPEKQSKNDEKSVFLKRENRTAHMWITEDNLWELVLSRGSQDQTQIFRHEGKVSTPPTLACPCSVFESLTCTIIAKDDL